MANASRRANFSALRVNNTRRFYPNLVPDDVRGTGCGCGVPPIEYPQNWAPELANATRRANVSALSVNTEQCKIPACCLDNRAVRDAVLGSLALSIRKVRPSNWRMRVTAPISPHSASTSDRLTPTSRLETYTEQDAAADGLALSIRKIGTSNRRMRVAGPKVPHKAPSPDIMTPHWCLEI